MAWNLLRKNKMRLKPIVLFRFIPVGQRGCVKTQRQFIIIQNILLPSVLTDGDIKYLILKALAT